MNADGNIVISSRVRLARNVEGLPFPHKLRYERAAVIAKEVYDALAPTGTYNLYRVANSGELDLDVLKETHLISADLLHTDNGAAIINDSETVSVMINEEDHIREQCILRGLGLEKAYEQINAVDDAIGAKIKYAFDERLGYLTCCPTNVGTGMRASVMLFLPALALTDSIENCVSAVSRLNMTVRGVYGEGSKAEGFIYQVSSCKTLGVGESEIVSSVTKCIDSLVESELMARDRLFHANGAQIRDKVQRAWGLLTNAYSLSTEEFMSLMAFVKLGAYEGYGLIELRDADRFEKLITEAQPANIINISGKALDGDMRSVTASQRDILRASYVAKTLKNVASRK